MHQRHYRPGDVLDDYCPRERRITDHAIVAMVDSEIQRTRCVGCDAEHEFKNAKVPSQRKKGTTAALFSQVLETMDAGPGRPAAPHGPADVDEGHEAVPTDVEASWRPESADALEPTSPAAQPPQGLPRSSAAPATPSPDSQEDRPFRRSLIRAQLPRTEGQPPTPRAIPEFTMHQPLNHRGKRAGHGRFRRRPGQGGESGGGPMRFGRDQGQGFGQGQGQGQSRHRRRRKKH
jgi:hypothetical protein